MTNKKKSSIEFIEEQLFPCGINVHAEIFQQAKEMHKQEIVRSVEHGYLEMNNSGQYGVGETYYQQTFDVT